MGTVTHNFNAAKTQGRNFFQRFIKREFNKGVGGVAEYHISSFHKLKMPILVSRLTGCRLAGIKLRVNRHNGPTGTTLFNFSSL
jgi:uncharacterized Fe-S radical SAM superfamily protein PflX